MKILDCTLRDGGYYTNWDFDKDLVKTYCKSMESLPIDYVEIGYRSIPIEGYLGEYFYCPEFVMKELKEWMPSKKLVIILNEKDIRASHVPELLKPCLGYISMVRIAIDPVNFARAIELAKAIKVMGFEVGFNVMYMSKWKEDNSFLDLLDGLDDTIDYFYMVDSFGGVFQQDVIETINLVKSKTNVKLGFHGHNNLEMALANTITAMNEGCNIIDATITGMGRGAGNLKTELLLTYLTSQDKIKLDFNILEKVVSGFCLLQNKYGWGANLPYMVSGANSLPQKDVMAWVTTGRFSFNSIIRALQNLSNGIEDNENLEVLNDSIHGNTVLLIGGGPSVSKHYEAICILLKNNTSTILVHASSKHASLFKKFPNKQYFCLVGNEGQRMEEVFDGNFNTDSLCVLPPYPRLMGTFVPKSLIKRSFQLEKYDFTNLKIDSHTSIALQLISNMKSKKIMIIGYDGYKTELLDETSQELIIENNKLFKDFIKTKNIQVESLFDTVYNLPINSIYSIIS